MTKEKLNRNSICLLGTHAINSILYMFINTFLVAYFFTITNYNYKIISLYYLASFIAIPLCFWLLGDVVKTKSKVMVYRIGIVLYCIYILVIAFLKEQILEHYIILGFFYGVVQGFFWAAGHVLVNEVAGKEKLSKKFVSIKSIIGDICDILFPIIFGASIQFTSFFYIAKIIVPISIVQLTFSLFIKEEKNKNKENFNIIKYVKFIKNSKSEKIKTLYRIMFYEGIVHYLRATLITIVIVMTFKTTLNLGILTTIFSIFSIISVYIFQKVYINKKPKKCIIMCAAMLFLSVLGLLFEIDKTTVIIYNLVNSIFMVLLINYADIKRYSSTETYKEIKEKYLVEHQVLCESVLGVSRILSYTVLFIVSLLNNIIYFKILLLLATLCTILYAKELYKD